LDPPGVFRQRWGSSCPRYPHSRPWLGAAIAASRLLSWAGGGAFGCAVLGSSFASAERRGSRRGIGNHGNLPGPGPGRPKGMPNKFNGQLKEALLSAFNGAHPDGLASWVLQEAKANPTAGLALLGRLIPVSTEGTLDATLTVRHVDETAD
jgi:hypothetical protein